MRQLGKAMAHTRRKVVQTRAVGLLLAGSSIASPCYAQEAALAADSEGSVSTSEVPAVEAETSASAASEQTNEVPDYAGRRAEEGYYDTSKGEYAQSYWKRYRPTGNEWEVTLFVGGLFPSRDHNLKVPELPLDLYSKQAVQLGFRLGYFPLSFLGAEFQSFVGGGSLRDAGYSALFYGLSGHLVAQLPLWSVIPFATVGMGTLGAASETMGHDRDPAFIWGAGLKAALSRRVNARFDFQDTLTQKRDAKNGRQTHHPAIQLGVSFVFEREPKRMPRIDADYDGLFDADDACPSEGALTVDGCKVLVDTDGDGIFDQDDRCPLEAGTSEDGCPNRDLDNDGVLLPHDQCPEEPGVAPTGCPDLDPDRDGISGDKDQCPNEPETKNGYEDSDGCPDEVPEEVKKFTGVIPGITFKQGTAVIEQNSRSTLDAAAKILTDYPSVQIEVSGHTSSEGAEQRNQTLSEERAEAVRKYFIEKGIAEERVIARGAGASEPVADNATNEGRQQNRRIEFRVVSQP